MSEHKYTDEEVIKALECCLTVDVKGCGECPYRDENCINRIMTDALDLINRQKAEIANLINAVDNSTKEFLKLHDEYQEQRAEIERLEKHNTEYARKHYQDGRVEAIKEFAERLKEKLIKGGIYPVLVKNSIDDLVKELTEEKE